MDAHIELWRGRSLVEKYRLMQGWIDAGERVVVNSIADEVRGQANLDLGVGAGRTTWLLRLLSQTTSRSTGLRRWSTRVARSTRASTSGEGDASNLSEIPTSRFKLVFFSYNGIDNLGHEDRLHVLDEARRVVQGDGLFVYSTLAKFGRAYMERPRLAPRRGGSEPAVKHAGRLLYGLVTGVPEYQKALRGGGRRRPGPKITATGRSPLFVHSTSRWRTSRRWPAKRRR